MRKKDKALIAEWKFKLATNNEWAKRGLVAIFARQTAFEQAQEVTAEQNGMGFTSGDGELMSSCAKFLQRTGFLTPKQMYRVKLAMPKYAAQLLIVAKAKGKVK